MRYNINKCGLSRLNKKDIKSFSRKLRRSIENHRGDLFLFDTSMFDPYRTIKASEFAYIIFDKEELLEDRINHAKNYAINQVEYGNELVNLIRSHENAKFIFGQEHEVEGYNKKLHYIANRINLFLKHNNLNGHVKFEDAINDLNELADSVNSLLENQNKLAIPSQGYPKLRTLLKKKIEIASKRVGERTNSRVSEVDKNLIYCLFISTLSGETVTLFSRDKHIPELCTEIIRLHKEMIENEVEGDIFGIPIFYRLKEPALNYHTVSLEFWPSDEEDSFEIID